MKVKTEDRKKIEAMSIGGKIYFRRGKAIRVQGYVNRINDSARREGKIKKDLNPFSYYDGLCDKKGFVCVVRNY